LSGIVFFAVFTLLCLAITVSAIGAKQFNEVATYGLGTILFGHLTGMSISFYRTPQPASGPPLVSVTDQGERGLAFRYSRLAYYWLVALLVLLIIFFAGLAFALARRGSPIGWVIVAVAVLSAIFLLWFVVTILRLAPGTVVVTPGGIYHRSLAFEHFVPWAALVDVQAREGRSPRILVEASRTAGTRERPHTGPFGAGIEGLPSMSIRAYWLGANALPAYVAIRHYFRTPGDRPNLGVAGHSADR
jgi:hypothetical protein